LNTCNKCDVCLLMVRWCLTTLRNINVSWGLILNCETLELGLPYCK
jgi:hypothetical protein